LAEIKAVVFDFIGTLTNVQGYSLETSELKLYKALVEAGFNTNPEDASIKTAVNVFFEDYLNSLS